MQISNENSYNGLMRDLLDKKVSEVVELTINNLAFGNIISVEYKEALATVVNYIMFYKKEDKIATLPMITGGGKSTALKNAMAYMVNDDILFPYSGTIILMLQQEDCNDAVRDINIKAGKEVAYSYHSGKDENRNIRNRISKKKLEKYPILIMCHEGFKELMRDNNYDKILHWTDGKVDRKTSDYNKFLRRRLIIDEEISSIKIQNITPKTIEKVKNGVWNMGNKELFDKFGEFIKGIEEEFVKPYEIKRNSSKFIYVDIKVPEELDQYIYEYCDREVQECYISLLNFINHGGYVQYSDDVEKKSITTYGYIDINSPLFHTVQLDATANINYLYKINNIFEIIEIPQFKTYKNTYIHIFDEITGSRSKIEDGFENGLLESCIKDIKDKSNENDKVLIILNKKELVEMFKEKYYQDDNTTKGTIDFVYYGSLTGKNHWRDYNKLFSIGIQILGETIYPIYYYLNSGEKDFNKYDTTMKPVKGARVYKEMEFERVRLSMIAKELIQGINRIRCRLYQNGDTPEAHIYLINKDKEIDRLIQLAMPGVNIAYDWDLDYTDKNEENKRHEKYPPEYIIIGIIKRIQEDEIFRQELIDTGKFTSKGIKKQILRELCEIRTRDTFNKALKSPLFQEFSNDKQIDINTSHYIKINY